jgi:hypothetical protein
VPYILQYLATTQHAKLGLSPADAFSEGHTYYSMWTFNINDDILEQCMIREHDNE